jgi:ribosomal protein S17
MFVIRERLYAHPVFERISKKEKKTTLHFTTHNAFSLHTNA